MKAVAFTDPTREWREAMKTVAFADPMRELRETMKALTFADPMREWRDAMKAVAFADPMRELRETMKALTFADPMREWRDAIKAVAFADPVREWRDAMKAVAFADPIRELRDAMKAVAFADPMRELRDAMKAVAFADPMRELREALSTLGAVRRLSRSAISDQLRPEEESAIDVEQEVHAAVSRIAVHASAAEPSPTQLFQAILAELEAQRSTKARWVLCNVVLPLVLSLIVWLLTRTVDPYLPRILPISAGSASQQTAPLLAKAVDDIDALRDLRVAVGRTIRVRASSKKTSHVFDSLKSGQVVVLITKRGQRALVGFSSDAHGYSAAGWVEAKYLQQIRRP